jgi:hypothetical protein
MPTYINKDGTNTLVSSATNIYARNDTGWSRIYFIKVYNGSTWQQVYTYDSTVPSIGNWSVSGNDSNQMTFSWSGGALVTDADSGVASVQVEYQYTPWGGSGEGWQAWQNWTANQWAATSGSYSFTVATAKRATQTNLGNGFYDIANRYFVDFRVTATDNVGNATSKTIANGQLTRPYGTFYIVPPFNSSTGFTYADSYQLTSGGGNIGFYGLVSQAVRSGNGISVGGLNWSYGCWFYGDDVEKYHLIKDASNNRYKADSGSLQVQRYQSSGTSGTWAWQQHDLRFSNGSTGATFLGNILTASISGPDAAATLTLDAGHLTNFSTLSAKGFGMVRNGSSNYRVMRNYLQDLSASGRITLVFN